MFRRSGVLLGVLVVSVLAPMPADAAGLPDLIVKSMAAPSSVLAGKTITVSTTVANIRRPKTASSYVRVVLSRDRVLQGTDRVLGNRWVPGLPVNGTSTGKQTYTIPSTTAGGTWYLVACADATKRIKEYREGNNCRSVALTVTRPNRLPVAHTDAFVTNEDQALPLTATNLLANDTDPDAGTTLRVTAVGSPTHGVLSPLVSGAFTFTPATDFHGTSGFTYTLSDGKASVQGAVVVTVEGVNDLPIANADQAATAHDTGVLVPLADLLSNDTDVDAGDVLSVTAVQDASHGTASLDVAQAAVSFTPESGFFGDAGFAYVLSDGSGTTVGTVTVHVAAPPLTLVLAPASATVGEGATTTVDVHLSRAPAGDVTVTVAPAAGSSGIVAASPATLTFTPANWNTPQSVTVTGVNDDDLADEAGAVLFSAAGIETAQASWTVLDDDTQLIQASPVSVTVTEGSTTTFGVRLAFQPAGDVTVSVGSADTTVATVSSSSLVFTPSNWATPQNVTVNGIEDVDLANESVVISLTSTGLTSKSVTTTVSDNDVQAVKASAANKSIFEGSTTTVGITLAYQPATNTTVTCSSSPSGSVGVSPSTLTFTPSNYFTPQNITLTGIVDGDQVDDEATVTCSATAASSATIAVIVIESV
jgi:hypothetical protein